MLLRLSSLSIYEILIHSEKPYSVSFTNNFPTNSGFMSQFLCFITEFQSDFLIFAEVERCVCLFVFFGVFFW